MLARKLQGAGGVGGPSDSLDLSYLGYVQPITSTSATYNSVTCNLSSLSSSVSSENYWYIMGIASRDASGDLYGDFASSATVTVDGSSTVTAKLIGKQGTASHANSFSTVGFYAWQSSGTSFSVAVSLADTHEGGVNCVLYEFEHTGSELYWGDGFNSHPTASSSLGVTTEQPNFAFSTMGTASPSNDRVHILFATGTSNCAAGVVNDNFSTTTWVSDLYDEHGTNEWSRFSRSEVVTTTSWVQTVNNAQAPSNQTNVHLALTISAA
jgi:hypothetical protein